MKDFTDTQKAAGKSCMTEFKAVLVPTPLVEYMWLDVLDLLRKPIDNSNGEVTVGSTLRRAMAGEISILVFMAGSSVECVATVEVLTFESGKRSLSLPLFAGNNIERYGDLIQETVVGLAKTANCENVRGMSIRKGWMSMLTKYGWQTDHQIISYTLGDKS